MTVCLECGNKLDDDVPPTFTIETSDVAETTILRFRWPERHKKWCLNYGTGEKWRGEVVV